MQNFTCKCFKMFTILTPFLFTPLIIHSLLKHQHKAATCLWRDGKQTHVVFLKNYFAIKHLKMWQAFILGHSESICCNNSCKSFVVWLHQLCTWTDWNLIIFICMIVSLSTKTGWQSLQSGVSKLFFYGEVLFTEPSGSILFAAWLLCLFILVI